MGVLTNEDLLDLRQSAALFRAVINEVVAAARAGATTDSLDQLAEAGMQRVGLRPSFKTLPWFGRSISTSAGSIIINGKPRKERLVDGTLLRLQMGAERNGVHLFSAQSVPVGVVKASASAQVTAAMTALKAAASHCVAGVDAREISTAISGALSKAGLHAVREFVGNGTGRVMHDRPAIPCYEDPQTARYVLRRNELLSLQVMATNVPARLVIRDHEYIVQEAGVCAVHVGALVVVAHEPEVLIWPAEQSRSPGAQPL